MSTLRVTKVENRRLHSEAFTLANLILQQGEMRPTIKKVQKNLNSRARRQLVRAGKALPLAEAVEKACEIAGPAYDRHSEFVTNQQKIAYLEELIEETAELEQVKEMLETLEELKARQAELEPTCKADAKLAAQNVRLISVLLEIVRATTSPEVVEEFLGV